MVRKSLAAAAVHNLEYDRAQALDREITDAAVIIQSAWRGFLVRNQVRQMKQSRWVVHPTKVVDYCRRREEEVKSVVHALFFGIFIAIYVWNIIILFDSPSMYTIERGLVDRFAGFTTDADETYDTITSFSAMWRWMNVALDELFNPYAKEMSLSGQAAVVFLAVYYHEGVLDELRSGYINPRFYYAWSTLPLGYPIFDSSNYTGGEDVSYYADHAEVILPQLLPYVEGLWAVDYYHAFGITRVYSDTKRIVNNTAGAVNEYNLPIGGLYIRQSRRYQDADGCHTDAFTQRVECYENRIFKEPFRGSMTGFVYEYLEESDGYLLGLDLGYYGRAYSDVKTLLEVLEFDNWLDRQTSEVVVELAVYNPNLDLYGYARVTWEITLGGYIDASLYATSVSMSGLSEDAYSLVASSLLFVGVVVVCGTILHGLIYTYRLNGRLLPYLTNFFHILDIFILTFLMIVISATIRFFVDVEDVNLPSIDSVEGITTEGVLDVLRFQRDIVDFSGRSGYLQTLHAVAILMCIVRFFKYFASSARMSVFTRTLSEASKDLAHFGVIVALVITGYAFIGYIAFGHQDMQFRTFGLSLHTILFVAITGEIEYDGMLSVNTAIANMYYWSYVILVYFLIINMLISIVLDAHFNVKVALSEETKQQAQIANMLEGFVAFPGPQKIVRNMFLGEPSPKSSRSSRFGSFCRKLFSRFRRSALVAPDNTNSDCDPEKGITDGKPRSSSADGSMSPRVREGSRVSGSSKSPGSPRSSGSPMPMRRASTLAQRLSVTAANAVGKLMNPALKNRPIESHSLIYELERMVRVRRVKGQFAESVCVTEEEFLSFLEHAGFRTPQIRRIFAAFKEWRSASSKKRRSTTVSKMANTSHVAMMASASSSNLGLGSSVGTSLPLSQSKNDDLGRSTVSITSVIEEAIQRKDHLIHQNPPSAFAVPPSALRRKSSGTGATAVAAAEACGNTPALEKTLERLERLESTLSKHVALLSMSPPRRIGSEDMTLPSGPQPFGDVRKKPPDLLEPLPLAVTDARKRKLKPMKIRASPVAQVENIPRTSPLNTPHSVGSGDDNAKKGCDNGGDHGGDHGGAAEEAQAGVAGKNSEKKRKEKPSSTSTGSTRGHDSENSKDTGPREKGSEANNVVEKGGNKDSERDSDRRKVEGLGPSRKKVAPGSGKDYAREVDLERASPVVPNGKSEPCAEKP
eukprot:Rmarinus@m.19887